MLLVVQLLAVAYLEIIMNSLLEAAFFDQKEFFIKR